MDPRSKNTLLAGCLALLFALGLQIVPEAKAVFGRRAMRTAVVVSAASANASKSSSSQSQQQGSTQPSTGTSSTTTAAPAPSTTTTTPAKSGSQPAAAPLGSVVSTLPAGCQPMTKNDIEYQHCGNTYYRTAFQGSDLVYVSAQP